MKVEGVFPAKGKCSSTQHHSGRKRTWSPSLPPLPGDRHQPRGQRGKPAAWGKQIALWPSKPQQWHRGERDALERLSHSTASPAACSSSSGNPKPGGLWRSTSPLPVEEDGFHQGDHIPARVVPGAHNRNVQELPRDKRRLFETGLPHRALSAPPWGCAMGKDSITQPFPERGGSPLAQKWGPGVWLPLLLSGLPLWRRHPHPPAVVR